MKADTHPSPCVWQLFHAPRNSLVRCGWSLSQPWALAVVDPSRDAIKPLLRGGV
ncbi:hypothetical protein [Vulcanisaeta distributa]|uniref:hypothetical protein n=1 Tax=Vulcanisaeta distributa TaxID=164451 RepID=UPI000AEED1B0|nr:hypothetical protein [Vulcanisaeta distributa]